MLSMPDQNDLSLPFLWDFFSSCHLHLKPFPSRLPYIIAEIPEHVVLDPVPIMEMGKVYNLTCRVASAAPIQLLTVTLYKGTEKLHIETFENHNAPGASDILVTFPITAQQDNHMEEVTCHIALDMRPRGQLLEKTSFSEVLKVFGELQVSSSYYYYFFIFSRMKLPPPIKVVNSYQNRKKRVQKLKKH